MAGKGVSFPSVPVPLVCHLLENAARKRHGEAFEEKLNEKMRKRKRAIQKEYPYFHGTDLYYHYHYHSYGSINGRKKKKKCWHEEFASGLSVTAGAVYSSSSSSIDISLFGEKVDRFPLMCATDTTFPLLLRSVEHRYAISSSSSSSAFSSLARLDKQMESTKEKDRRRHSNNHGSRKGGGGDVPLLPRGLRKGDFVFFGISSPASGSSSAWGGLGVDPVDRHAQGTPPRLPPLRHRRLFGVSFSLFVSLLHFPFQVFRLDEEELEDSSIRGFLLWRLHSSLLVGLKSLPRR